MLELDFTTGALAWGRFDNINVFFGKPPKKSRNKGKESNLTDSSVGNSKEILRKFR